MRPLLHGLGGAGYLLLSLTTAGFLLSEPTHAATAPEVRQFLDHSGAAANARLAKAGVSLAGQTADVRATVGGDGRLMGLRVVRSSGSRDTDAAIEKALDRLQVEAPPALLSGAQITLPVGGGQVSAATTPTGGS
jgi:TonB family protein